MASRTKSLGGLSPDALKSPIPTWSVRFLSKGADIFFSGSGRRCSTMPYPVFAVTSSAEKLRTLSGRKSALQTARADIGSNLEGGLGFAGSQAAKKFRRVEVDADGIL